MSSFVPKGYLTIDQAIDCVANFKRGDADPPLIGEEEAILQYFQVMRERAMRPKPQPVVPVLKATGRGAFIRSKVTTYQPSATPVEDLPPKPKVTRAEIQEIRRKKALLEEQRAEAAQELQQLLYAGTVPSKTITEDGALLETPKHIWGGDQWHEHFSTGSIKWFDRRCISHKSGRPLISQDALKAVFKPAKTQSVIGAETRCERWLEEKAWTWQQLPAPIRATSRPVKAELEEEALQMFESLSKKGFQRVWDKIAPAEWTKSGPKRSKSNS